MSRDRQDLAVSPNLPDHRPDELQKARVGGPSDKNSGWCVASAQRPLGAPDVHLPAAVKLSDSPPQLPFVFAVGVTGHRKDALVPEELPHLEERLRTILKTVASKAARVYAANREFFSAAAPRLVFVSPLADGADQIAAEIALELGYELQAVLPFARDQYRTDLPDEDARARYGTLLAQAACVLELPGGSDHRLESYVMAGRATIAHSDLLIAIWDGLPPRGRGGTGEVVSFALTGGTPLIHVPIGPEGAVTLRWSAYDPSVITRLPEPSVERPFSPGEVQRLMTALITPPPDSAERRFIKTFQKERSRGWRMRIEYPLLLALAGAAEFKKSHLRADSSAATRSEWKAYRDNCCEPHGVKPPLDELQEWYEWSDRLATHFAQSYRSGQVFNFVSAAGAVLIALSALVVPQVKAYLAAAEFSLILLVLLNTMVGVRHEWHRRWLDYRQLAERLRPMRSLKLLGIAAPNPPGSATTPIARRWVDWYAAAVWRATGCPDGGIERASIPAISRAISCHELRPQIDYHRSGAAQVKTLDHGLERIGIIAFTCSLISCAVLLAGLVVDKGWVDRNFDWFTIASAGFPAIGAAIFGIRLQGDFGGSAARSESTANTLAELAAELEDGISSLMRSADLTEQAARAMLSDLDEWRLLIQQHDLSVG